MFTDYFEVSFLGPRSWSKLPRDEGPGSPATRYAVFLTYARIDMNFMSGKDYKERPLRGLKYVHRLFQ